MKKREFTKSFLSGVLVALLLLVGTATYAWEGNIIEGWLVDAGVLKPADSSWTVEVGSITADEATFTTTTVQAITSSTILRADRGFFSDGDVSNPSMSFSDYTGTGLWTASGNKIYMSLNGTGRYLFHQSFFQSPPEILPYPGNTPLELRGSTLDGGNSLLLNTGYAYASGNIAQFANNDDVVAEVDYLGFSYFGGTFEKATATSTSSTMSLATGQHMNVDTTSAPVTIDIASALIASGTATKNVVFSITDTGGNASANNITITTEGAETISGQASITINSDYSSYDIKCNGSNCFIY